MKQMILENYFERKNICPTIVIIIRPLYMDKYRTVVSVRLTQYYVYIYCFFLRQDPVRVYV